MAIKISIKDAERLAEVIGDIVERDPDNLTARAIVQAISWVLPEKVSASVFRTACTGILDLSGRNYVAEVKSRFP